MVGWYGGGDGVCWLHLCQYFRKLCSVFGCWGVVCGFKCPDIAGGSRISVGDGGLMMLWLTIGVVGDAIGIGDRFRGGWVIGIELGCGI